jgi:LysR family transcriptional activator of nhaA
MYGTVNTIRQEEHNVLVDNVLKGNIDWGISVQKPKRKNVDFAEIGSFDLVFCCANDLYKKFKNKEDILINIPFAENSWDINLSKLIAVHLRKSGIVPREKIFSDHSGFIKKLCKRGRCVMCIPENPLEKDEDFKTFKLKDPLRISLYAIWRKADENLVSIQKLKELISSKLTHTPFRYKDIDLQIEVSEVSDELLRKKSK